MTFESWGYDAPVPRKARYALNPAYNIYLLKWEMNGFIGHSIAKIAQWGVSPASDKSRSKRIRLVVHAANTRCGSVKRLIENISGFKEFLKLTERWIGWIAIWEFLWNRKGYCNRNRELVVTIVLTQLPAYLLITVSPTLQTILNTFVLYSLTQKLLNGFEQNFPWNCNYTCNT